MSTLTTEHVTEKVSAQFGDKILSAEMLYDMLTLTVEHSACHDVLKYLHDEPSLNFHFLTTLCGLHYPDSSKPFGVMYQLHNMPENVRVRIKAFTGGNDPEFKTITDIWNAANWQERETYDFFGIRFAGHPDLRRIMNMDSMVGWPLRKEFPLEDPFRRDKDDKMFGR